MRLVPFKTLTDTDLSPALYFRSLILITFFFIPYSFSLPWILYLYYSLEDDLKVANYQLVKTRRERLRALYSEELQQWQQELKKKGLSIDRRTD